MRRCGLSGEHLQESLKQREERFRFAGDQAVKQKDLEEEGEERASAALKSVARRHVEATWIDMQLRHPRGKLRIFIRMDVPE
jgi:hypothetical protein